MEDMKNIKPGYSKTEILNELVESLFCSAGNGIFVVDTSVIIGFPFDIEANTSSMEKAELKADYYQKIAPWICDPRRILTRGTKGEVQKLILFNRFETMGKKGFEKYNFEAENIHRRLISKAVYQPTDRENEFFNKIEEYGQLSPNNFKYVGGCSGEDKESIEAVLDMSSRGVKTGLISQDFKQLILMEEMAKYLRMPLKLISYNVPDKKYGLRSI